MAIASTSLVPIARRLSIHDSSYRQSYYYKFTDFYRVSGGGFPGWLTRVNGTFRANSTGFLDATDLYARQVGNRIAKAQITNGGPVILFQPENE